MIFPRRGPASLMIAAVFVGAMGVASSFQATPAGARSLRKSLTDAYHTNPRLKAARAQLKEIDEQAAQAISNWRPNVSLSADAGRAWNNSRSTRSIPSTTSRTIRNPRGVNLTISQIIWRGGRNFAQLRQAEGNIRAQRARLLSTEQAVFLDVVRAHMNVVRDLAVVRLSEVNSVRLARQLRATRDRFSVGEVTRTDVAQAQARVARARADLVRAEGDLQNSRANYRNLVGRLPNKLRQPRRLLRIPRRRVHVINQARRYHPDVVASIYAERAAHAGVDLVRGELLPSLSVEGTMGHNRDSGSPRTATDSATITARLTVPLYQSGAVMSRIRAAKQGVFRLRHDRAQAYRTVTENATRGWNSFRTASSQVRAFRSEARANSIALEGVRQEARAGLRTVLDVLDAQQELFQSRVDLVRSERDRVVAAYEVWAAMGRLTTRQLRLRVKRFDPKAYYKAVKYKLWGFGRSVGKPPRYNPKKP